MSARPATRRSPTSTGRSCPAAAAASTPTPTPSAPAASSLSGNPPVDPGVLAVVLDALGASVLTPSAALAAALGAEVVDLAAAPDGQAESLALGDDELSRAGEHAEGLVAEAARVLRPGGVLLATARNPLLLPSGSGLRGFSSAQLAGALTQRGFTIELLCAPGAAARVTGTGQRDTYDPERDRLPGLLDAAPRLVAVARSPRSAQERSATFFATIPRKVVAAAVICRDRAGRLLVVHDAFRGHWTIPGGVVDTDEDPLSGAAREAWEEAGVRVTACDLLGLFASPWPDRLVLVYGATPLTEPADPQPVHTHEVDDARWLPLDEALRQLNPRARWQVDHCLTDPGKTWHQ